MARLLLAAVVLAGVLHADRALAQSAAAARDDVPPPLFQPPVEAKPEKRVRTFEEGEGEKKICVEVEVNGIRSFNCSNESFRSTAEKTPPTFNIPPIDAHAADTRTGVANRAAVKQQYGRNFGKSVVPYRP